eukprot:2590014-Rhodomonas_salina.2
MSGTDTAYAVLRPQLLRSWRTRTSSRPPLPLLPRSAPFMDAVLHLFMDAVAPVYGSGCLCLWMQAFPPKYGSNTSINGSETIMDAMQP